MAAHANAIWRGDAKTGIKHARKYGALFEQLRVCGDAGRDALAVLFNHPRIDVRVMAVTHLLRYRKAESKAILEEAAKREGLVSFKAEQALRRWKEGVWGLGLE